MSRLQGKVAIVTGAASGIGEGTARRFAEEGAQLVICDVQADKLEDVAASINSARGEKVCVAVPADVSRATDIEGVCQQAAERCALVAWTSCTTTPASHAERATCATAPKRSTTRSWRSI